MKNCKLTVGIICDFLLHVCLKLVSVLHNSQVHTAVQLILQTSFSFCNSHFNWYHVIQLQGVYNKKGLMVCAHFSVSTHSQIKWSAFSKSPFRGLFNSLCTGCWGVGVGGQQRSKSLNALKKCLKGTGMCDDFSYIGFKKIFQKNFVKGAFT